MTAMLCCRYESSAMLAHHPPLLAPQPLLLALHRLQLGVDVEGRLAAQADRRVCTYTREFRWTSNQVNMTLIMEMLFQLCHTRPKLEARNPRSEPSIDPTFWSAVTTQVSFWP